MSRLITIAALRRFACYVCAALLVAACEDTTNPAMQKLASPSLQVLGASSNVTIRTTELGPIPVNQGFNRCGARRVSNNGLAVGGCENPFTGQTRAVTWLLDPSIPSSLDAHDLGLGPFADERNVGPVAEDVNDDALIVGEGFVSPTEGDRAFIFGTGFTLLAPLGNAARGINRFGQVVGGLRGGHAVLWTSPSTIMDLGTLGGLFSAASDINDNGQVVGQSDVDFGFVVRAFLWTADKGMAELPAPFGQSSRAVAINNTGQVAGFLGAFTGLQAVMWEPNGEMHFLGTLGGAASAANDINELGWVVGWSTTASDEVHGFVWTDQTGMVDLGTFSGNPTMAMGVNNRGEVVGIAVTRGSLPQPALVWRVELGMVNRPPIASAGGPYSGLEDSPVTFDANGSTDLDGDALTFEWDLGDGATATGVAPTHTYTHHGTFVVTLTVTDAGGLSAAAATTASIENVLPTVGAIQGETILQGETFTSFGSFTDPGTEVWTATVDYGDGSGVIPLLLIGKTFSLTHLYGTPGTYTVTVTVADDGGGVGISHATVIVQSPQQASQTLWETVDALVQAGQISAGNGNALDAKLQAAIAQLARGNTRAPVNQLNAFINQVTDLLNSGAISPTDGQTLIEAAKRILRAIQNA